MKKSEVIKLMKEGSHGIYDDCPDKKQLLLEIATHLFPHPHIKEQVKNYISHFYWLDKTGYNSVGNFIHVPPKLEIINLSEIEPDNEKPYLFYEGEKYYFGEEYEFSDHPFERYVGILKAYISDCDHPFKTNKDEYRNINKIDHITKYKKLLLELKEQAEKDGVNLKELI